ncbi:MAG TPA: hypothetical protein VHZ05_05555 [Acidimicrobiales bacterium]|jgi:hypothetical protein|nr:hypothetical protein [Acidimicrobiales bacterium]
MPRRNLVPLMLLAVLAVLAAGFAVLGAMSAPTSTTIQVQNAADKTFGTPTGANSWIMELVTSVNVGVGTANGTTERLIDYSAPDRMVVYDVSGSSAKIAGVLRQPAVSCVLSSYSAMLEGEASWNQKGSTFKRTESLADYSARVPRASGAICKAVASTTQGQVHETAILRSDYLVAARAQVVAPAHGSQGETLVFIRIGNVPVRTLKN